MKKIRIVTNGEKFKVQYKGWLFWHDYGEYVDDYVDDEDVFNRKSFKPTYFNTWDEAFQEKKRLLAREQRKSKKWRVATPPGTPEPIREGSVKKGGVNDPPTTPKPKVKIVGTGKRQ